VKLTQDQANARLNDERNAINIIHKQLYADRAKGIKLNVPTTVRALIGITSNHDGAKRTANAFGVSEPLAIAASRGQVVGSSTRGQSRDDLEVKSAVGS